MHEEAYNNSLTKIKHAGAKLAAVRDKIARYDAELKTSRAEAEMAKLAQELNIDVTSDFGQIEQVVQDKIGANRAKARVAADLSGDGIAGIEHERQMESLLADQALREFEVQAGLVAPAQHSPRPQHWTSPYNPQGRLGPVGPVGGGGAARARAGHEA